MKKALAALAGTETDDDAIGVLLLEDIRQILTEKGSDKIFSEDLVKALHTLEERPWSEWGQHRKPISKTQLAGLLRPFEIRPTTVDIASVKAKGYHKADFTDAWQRYLPSPPIESDPRSVTSLQESNDAGMSASLPLRANNDANVTAQNTRNPTPQNECNGVTDLGIKKVTAQNTRNPAAHQGYNGVTDRSAQNGEGQNKAIQVGDWVNPLSADGVVWPDPAFPLPYLVSKIEPGSDGALYVQFLENGKH